jgi:hypothetical protein
MHKKERRTDPARRSYILFKKTDLLGDQAASARRAILFAECCGLVLGTGRNADTIESALAGDIGPADLMTAATKHAGEFLRQVGIGFGRLVFRRQRGDLDA